MVLAKYGIVMPEGWSDDCVGMPEEHALAKIRNLHPAMREVDDLMEQRRACYYEALARDSEKMAYPGVPDRLRDLRETGLKLAVVTNSVHECAANALAATGLARHFSLVIARDTVGTCKPDPAIYAAAADRLGVDPENCVVIEDSAAGITAGKKAGCLVLGVRNNTAGEELGGADAIFDSTAAAMSWIHAKHARPHSIRRIADGLGPVRVTAFPPHFSYQPAPV